MKKNISIWVMPNQKKIKIDANEDWGTGGLCEAICASKQLTFSDLYKELKENYAYYGKLDEVILKFIENGFGDFVANDWFVPWLETCRYYEEEKLYTIPKKESKEINKIAKRRIKKGIEIPKINERRKCIRPIIGGEA